MLHVVAHTSLGADQHTATPLQIFSRASRMLRGATQPVSVCVCVSLVCLCVEIFFPTNPYLQLVWLISMKFGMMGGLRG